MLISDFLGNRIVPQGYQTCDQCRSVCQSCRFSSSNQGHETGTTEQSFLDKLHYILITYFLTSHRHVWRKHKSLRILNALVSTFKKTWKMFNWTVGKAIFFVKHPFCTVCLKKTELLLFGPVCCSWLLDCTMISDAILATEWNPKSSRGTIVYTRQPGEFSQKLGTVLRGGKMKLYLGFNLSVMAKFKYISNH